MSRVWLLTAAVLLCGCGKEPVREPEQPKPEPPKPAALLELLGKPRKELAALEEECADKVRMEARDFEADAGANPWDAIRLPLTAPIWQEATYSEKAGFCLPAYLAPEAKDNALAWHLARHGDLDAARHLADASEADTLSALHRRLYERNYPLEWTRLVARRLQLAQLRLRRGENDGADDIISLHEQLRQTLDTRARNSPLGAALLATGRRSLLAARKAWKAEKAAERLSRTDAALASWGHVPPPSPSLLPGMSRALVERLWGCKSDGTLLVARDVVRALDASALPLPGVGVEAVAACFDAGNKLRETVVLYRPKLSLAYPTPADLAHHLEEHGLSATRAQEKAGLRRTVYALGEQRLEVVLCTTNGRLGGVVRLRPGAESAKAVPLPRDFGVVHLDASFEHNRLHCAPSQLADSVTFADPATLARLRIGLDNFRPLEAVLERVKPSPATRRLVVRADPEAKPARVLAGSLVAAQGFGTISAEDNAEGRHIAFVWEDGKTRYTLRLPNAARQPYEFEALTPDKNVALPGGEANVFDHARRRQRLAAGKPWRLLPRSLLFDQVKLGMTRADVEKVLPRAEKVPFGLRLVLSPRQARGNSFLPRQFIVRFAGGRVAEVRLLLLEAAKEGEAPLFATLQDKYGKTQPLRSRWASAWQQRSSPDANASLTLWQDDLTAMTYERLGGMAEWILRDRPRQQDSAIALERLTFCPRGVESCRLGVSKAEILRGWKGTTARDTTAEPLTLFPAGKGPFDAVLVWFKDDRATRIVARHAKPNDPKLTAVEMPRALNIAWGDILSAVGCWMQRGSRDGEILSLGWLDDVTRMRLFWNEDDGAPRVFSEWLDAPPSGPLPTLP